MNSKMIIHFLRFVVLSFYFLSSCATPSAEPTQEEPVQKEPIEVVLTEVVPPEIVKIDGDPGSVAILVIDDFNLGQPADESEISDSDNCLVAPSGQAHAAARGMSLAGFAHAAARGMFEVYELPPDIPHGVIVYDKFKDLFSPTYMNFETNELASIGLPDPPWIGKISSWTVMPNYPDIYVVQIDTNGYDTETITERIGRSIKTLQESLNIERFVFNMSFGVVPCDLDQEYHDYVDDINADTDLDELKNRIDDLVGSDPDGQALVNQIWMESLSPEGRVEFYKGFVRTQLAYVNQSSGEMSGWAKEISGGNDYINNFLSNPVEYLDSKFDIEVSSNLRVLAIAAAGNSGRDFPFAPALWNSVISVSAPPIFENSEVVNDYSNDGEVMMDGSFYDILGTSFAAPELSYEAALYLLKGYYKIQENTGVLTCEGEDAEDGTISTAPPLTYAGSGGPWQNRDLENAARYCCTDFLWPDLAEEPDSGEMVEIRWFVGLGAGTSSNQIEIQEDVVKNFNATHPNIELILEVAPYDSARDTLSTQIAAGNGPDIVGPVGIWGSNDFYGQWLDLDPLIDVTNYDLSAFNPALVNFYHTEQGQIGLPFLVFPSALYYQKNMFDQAGLNYPPQYIGDPYVWPDGSTVEWRWGVLSGVASLLTKDVNGLNLFEEGFDRNNIIQIGYVPQWSTPQIVGTFFEPGLVYRGQAGSYTASIPEGWKEAWYWWFDGMWGDQPFMPTGDMSSSPEFGSGNVFNSGRVAMAIAQLWYTCCLADAGDNWDLAALPSNNGEVHGRLDADTFFIWKGTEHPDEAFEVLTYLIGPEGTELLSVAYGGLPALPKYQDTYFDARAAEYPFVENWDLFIQTLNYPDIPSAESWMPNRYEATDRFDAFGQLIQNNGNINFQAELEALEADLEYYFNK